MRQKINKFGYLLLKPFIHWIFVSGSTRVRAIIVFGDEILLLRSWIGSQSWSLPGGGVTKGEEPENALRREIYEELNLDIEPKHYEEFQRISRAENESDYTAIIYKINLKSKQTFEIQKNEIIEADWHKINKLPSNLHPLAKLVIKELKN